jgi:tape measure domain-containing protein
LASGSAGSIYVDLLLRDTSFEQGLRKAGNSTNRFFGGIASQSSKAGAAIQAVINPVTNLSSAISTLGVNIGAALSIQQIIQYSDAWKQLQGRFSIVETDMLGVSQAQEELFGVAQRNRAPLAEVINFYQRLNQFVPESVRQQYDLLGVTESVTAALAITGENSLSAQAALVQFSQAIGTNFEASGQELRSIQEQAPRLAQALTNALGDGTKSLQKLKEEGILTRDSVLRALSGTGKEGRRLAEELSKIPLTVAQSFTQLDNAFLKFIGQSELISAGTSSLAATINLLAQNLDTVANGVVTVALAYTATYIPALISLSAAHIAAARNILAFNVLLGQLAFGSNAAAGAMLVLRGALLTVGAAFAFAVPAAAVLTLYEIVDGNDSLIESEKRLKEVVLETGKQLDANFRIHGKLTTEARAQVNERIEAYKKEVLALEAILKAQLDNKSNLELMARGVADFTGETILEGIFGREYRSLDEVVQKQKNYNDTIRELNSLLNQDRTPGKILPPEESEKARKQREKEIREAARELERYAKELQDLYDSNERFITGLSQEQFAYNQQVAEFERLWREGMISYQEYVNAVDFYNQEIKEKTEKSFIDMEAISKRAAENMQDAFADFLFDPFKDGLDGMLLSFVDTMRKMLAQQVAASVFGSILGSAGFSSFMKGGFNNAGQAGLPWQGFGSVNPQGGLYTGNFGGFFADGGFLQPGQWGIAGENGAEMIYGGRTGATVIPNGGKGGNTYYLDARGADDAAVARIEASLIALAGPGVIEKRVMNAQKRGAL